MAEKISYKTVTIFKETESGKVIYRVQSGISKTKFRTLAAAKRAIDRYITKYKRDWK